MPISEPLALEAAPLSLLAAGFGLLATSRPGAGRALLWAAGLLAAARLIPAPPAAAQALVALLAFLAVLVVLRPTGATGIGAALGGALAGLAVMPALGPVHQAVLAVQPAPPGLWPAAGGVLLAALIIGGGQRIGALAALCGCLMAWPVTLLPEPRLLVGLGAGIALLALALRLAHRERGMA